MCYKASLVLALHFLQGDSSMSFLMVLFAFISSFKLLFSIFLIECCDKNVS